VPREREKPRQAGKRGRVAGMVRVPPCGEEEEGEEERSSYKKKNGRESRREGARGELKTPERMSRKNEHLPANA
jgi:hypothetical protein